MNEVNHITLLQLLEVAEKVYEPEPLGPPWSEAIDKNGRLAQKGALGDTLAEFIIIEIGETYDPEAGREEQISEAFRVMSKATESLDRIVWALDGLQKTPLEKSS